VGVTGALVGVCSAALVLSVACGSDPEVAADDCPDCAIRLEHVATIGDGTGEGALDEQLQFVARDDRGRFIVTSNVEALPYLYDSTGTFLGRLGSEGEGPGQFTRASAVHVAADSLYVLDRGQGRILVFDGDLSYVRTATGLGPYYAAVPLAGGRFMANSSLPIGPPLTVYDANGGVVATVGDTVVGDSHATYLHQPRVLAPSSSGGVWTVFDRVFAGIGGDFVAEPRPDDLGFQPLVVYRLTLRAHP